MNGEASLLLRPLTSSLSYWNKLPAGTKAWIGLTAYVVGYDLYGLLNDKELLTEAFRRGLEDPVSRWLVVLAWGLTTKHLFFGKFLPWLDPFHLIGILAATISHARGR